MKVPLPSNVSYCHQTIKIAVEAIMELLHTPAILVYLKSVEAMGQREVSPNLL